MYIKKENIRYVVVLTIILSSPSNLVDYLLLKIGLSNTVFDFILLGSSVAIALMHSKQVSLTKFQKNVQIFFYILLVYLLVIWNADILFAGSQRSVFKAVVLAPLLMIIFNDSFFNFQKFIKYFLFVAFLLSLLSVIQYFGVPLGFIRLKPAMLLEGIYVGIGGFYHYLELGDVFGIASRNQGYFSEPTNFGQFLTLPLFNAGYNFFIRESKKSKMFDAIVFSTILLAYLLTFSVANFFGLFAGLIIYLFFRVRYKSIHIKSSLVKIISVLLLIAIGYSAFKFYEFTNSFTTDDAIIGKNTASNLTNRVGRNEVFFDRIIDHPFGDIDYKNEYTSATGMIGIIAIVGGYPLLILMSLFFLFYFRKIYIVMKGSKYLLMYAGLVAYMIPTIWDAKFYEYYFLFVIVFFSTLTKHEAIIKEIK
jgi:hypothetical protein